MLSIIIINYHSAGLIMQCLQSVYAGVDDAQVEVLVVDNSVGDGAKERILPAFTRVKWLQMPGNEGFARANNRGIREAGGDAVLLLNPDTVSQANAVEGCYHQLMTSNYAAVGVQLLNPDGTPQVSGNYIAPGGLNLLMQVPYFGNMLKLLAKKSGIRSTNLPEAKQPVTEVDWINGAFLMVKRSAIEKAGMLDEDFFLYHEESEWCSRLKRSGKLCIFGNLHVVHLEGQSSNKAFESATTGYSNLSDRKGYQLMLSMFVRIRKEFGVAWFILHFLCYTLSLPFILLFALAESVLRFSFSVFLSATGFSKNVIKCWQYLFIIIGNNPHFYKVL